MVRFASNQLVLHNGDVLTLQVVEIDNNGFFIANFPLTQELEKTLWLGGVFVLLPENILPNSCETIGDVILKVKDVKEQFKGSVVWRAIGVDQCSLFHSKVSSWRQVKDDVVF